MRAFLIACVMVLTGGAFYSAWTYKSGEIENDVTARVGEALGDDAIAFDVDGRHVALSGIVYDEATKIAHLDTAAATYGALGPIDGLSVQGDGGFVTIVKTPEGLALNGTVPTEEDRDTLIAQAQEATDGSVEDGLTVAGPAAEWRGEIPFGLTQMAQMSSGTLTASAAGFALSGTAQGDAGPLNDAVAGREGWQNLVSSAAEPGTPSEIVDRLRADITDRTTRISALETDLDTLTQDNADALAEMQGALDEAGSEITDQADQITDLTAENAALTTTNDELTSANTELTALLDIQTDEVSSVTTDATGLQAQLDTATQTITERDDEIAGLRANTSSQGSTITSLTATIAALQNTGDGSARIVELEGEADSLRQEAQDQTAALTTQIETRDATIASLTEDLGAEQAEVTRLNGALAEAETAPVDAGPDADLTQLQSQIDTLETTVSAREATIVDLLSQGAVAGDVATQCAARANDVLTDSNISFASGTARLTPNSIGLLERVTGIVIACSTNDLVVEVGGHTDAQGSDADNQTLSEARAQTVVDFMVARGVPADGLQAAGYGETTPIASNEAPEGRAQNRRITFEWQAR